MLTEVALQHGVIESCRFRTLITLQTLLSEHSCTNCRFFDTLLEPCKGLSNAKRQQKWRESVNADTEKKAQVQAVTQKRVMERRWELRFPPPPPSKHVHEEVICGFCEATSLQSLQEHGCAVCSRLMPNIQLTLLKDIPHNLGCLSNPLATRMERFSEDNPIRPLEGPVLAAGCDSACRDCAESLAEGAAPKYALSQGFWIGEVLDVLKDL